MKRALLVALAGAVLLVGLNRAEAPVSAQSNAPDALSFFKNYFITGDYVVGGVGLEGSGVNGVATGDISIGGVPAGADIQAAFLYWQVVTTATLGPDSGSVGATFDGSPLTNPDGPMAKVLGEFGTAPCWSSGGGTGNSGGSKRTYTYRADVLRFLDVDTDLGSPTYGKYLVNGTHTVTLPDSGSGNSTPKALGASLVVVYRDSTKPLSAVVIYDGSYTINNSAENLSQTIKGFYEAAATPNAKMTYIAGSGQSNKDENLFINGGFVASNPFSSSTGDSWDNPTFNVDAVTSDEVTTFVDTANLRGADCLTWGAIVFRTDVQDTDDDGLLDVWEQSTVSNPVVDPNGRALPPLGDMGALPDRKDVFVEIGSMFMPDATGGFAGDGVAPYGGVTKPAHTHLPTHEALKLVGDAFRDAPVGIAVHFDVGWDYPSGPADEFIVERSLARGGESLDERLTQCLRDPGSAPWTCQFSEYPGTLGWKTGFRFVRDQLVDETRTLPPLPGQDDVCDLPGAADGPGEPCERRFDSNRQDIFHYAFFAHAVGIPKGFQPCLSAGVPALVDEATGRCAAGDSENPDFRTPSTTSGVGDFPGGDVLVTLGGFPDTDGRPTGTPFMQASTLMHELGHNFERRHSGEPSTFALPNPNCKPTYLSVMNYLYQLRGLLNDAGKPHLDYSREVGPELNEESLSDRNPAGSPYRIGWYAPLDTSYMAGRAVPARSHCDGSPIPTDQNGALLERMVRIDARRAFDASSIDWNGNGLEENGLTLDINFNGRTTVSPDGTGGGESLRGSDDWSTIKLNQVASRRNIGGFFTDSGGVVRMGALSLDMGRFDMGRFDMGRFDMGRFDMGRFDMGQGDLGLGDLGRWDMGRFDMGRFDMGRFDMGRFDMGRFDMGAGDLGRGDYGGGGDLFQGDPNNQGGELDAETAGDLAKTPPNEFTACVIDVDCAAPAGSTGSTHDILAAFTAPNVGGVDSYVVYRVAGDTLTVGQTWTPVTGSVTPMPGQPGAYYVIDSSVLTNGAQYTFFAVAIYADGIQSDLSNLVTITAVNDPPTISSIPDQTIDMNGSTGPISFAISDENAGTVTTIGSSSDQNLVPDASIVFGGSGSALTVTVTPALNQFGTATITVTVTDAGGNTATDAFLVTVRPPTYDFAGFFSPLTTTGTDASPSDSGTVNFGKAIPLKWQVSLSGVIVSDLSSLQSLEAAPGTWTGAACSLTGAPALVLLNPGTLLPTGNSTYRFADSQFVFNWDTSSANQSNCYQINLALDDGSPVKSTVIRFR